MRALHALAVVVPVMLFAPSAIGAGSSKEECVEAHSRGQDLRERGQLTRSKQAFLTCAQSSCPALIQADCARFGEELARIVPTVTFGARDGSATDLPETTVYVDDTLVATHLDDGKAFELDPGKHAVRYVHDGKETTLRVVVNQGEKGRLLLATFGDREPPRIEPHDFPRPEPTTHRSIFPLVVAGAGVAAAATGGILYAIGMSRVPSSCSTSTNQCAAAPNDPTFAQAHDGVSLANVGLGVGIGGAVALTVGLVWYFVQPTTSSDTRVGRGFSPAFSF